MKGLRHSLAAAVLLSAAVAAAQTARPARQYTIDQFLTTTAISGASFSADETRILFSSNKSGIWNAYTIPVTGGESTAVTKSTTDSTYAVSFFPTDDRVLSKPSEIQEFVIAGSYSSGRRMAVS